MGDDNPVVSGFPKDQLIGKSPHQKEVMAVVAPGKSTGILSNRLNRKSYQAQDHLNWLFLDRMNASYLQIILQ